MSDFQTIYPEHRAKILVPLATRLQEYVEQCLKGVSRIDRVSARAKAVERFVQKALKAKADGTPKYSDPLSQIQDQIGVRIVTFYVSDVDRVSKIVETYLRPVEKQAILPESDSEFGYVGKHYILFVPTDLFDASIPRDKAPTFFELQIKTLFQHAWSEAEHDVGYKPTEALGRDQKRRIAFTAAQAWGADHIFNELFVEIEEAGRNPT